MREEFWQLPDEASGDAYLNDRLIVNIPESSYKHNVTVNYHVKYNGTMKKICRKAFLTIYKLRDWRVQKVIRVIKRNQQTKINKKSSKQDKTTTEFSFPEDKSPFLGTVERRNLSFQNQVFKHFKTLPNHLKANPMMDTGQNTVRKAAYELFCSDNPNVKLRPTDKKMYYDLYKKTFCTAVP